MILTGGHQLNLCDMELTRAAPSFTSSLTCFPDIVLIHDSSISQTADWSALRGWPLLASFLMFHWSSISHQEVVSGVYPIDSYSVAICSITNDRCCCGVGHFFLVGFPMCRVDDLCWTVLLLSAVQYMDSNSDHMLSIIIVCYSDSRGVQVSDGGARDSIGVYFMLVLLVPLVGICEITSRDGLCS